MHDAFQGRRNFSNDLAGLLGIARLKFFHPGAEGGVKGPTAAVVRV